jgi:Putative transposase
VPYITRPAIANERLTLNSAGQVVLTLKTAYRDSTTHIVMSPLEFMQRLAALVLRPKSTSFAIMAYSRQMPGLVLKLFRIKR